jgi:NB-ARC domain
VLDDVWCDKWVEELDQLFAPLRAGMIGSKILVTTQIEQAAKVLGCMNPIPLRELDEEQFFKLFMKNALDNAQISECLKEELMSIGKKIVTKLCRSPLAAKTVASQLRTRLDPDFWSNMLNSSLLKDTMGALYWSYQRLDPWLQRCFAFCSLFPKGRRFNQDHLVNLWIAEGFIEPSNVNEHITANLYILELISSSFFHGDEHNFYLHDLMHDLAQCVSGGEFVRIESGEQKQLPSHTRHIFVVDKMLGGYVDKMCKLEGLCTLIISRSYSDFSLKEVNFETLFTKLRKLCVLEIAGIDFKKVHDFVVHLKNLRYLNFEKVQGDANFNSVNKLYQLRILYTNSQIPHVGRLISLQHIVNFHVRERSGYELTQLKHLKNLCRSLSIHGLVNVKSKEEADQAKLFEKKGLYELSYNWPDDNWEDESRGSSRDNDVDILDGLCPPRQIKDLSIYGYSGKRFPSWILQNNNNFIHLKHLRLASCPHLETLQNIKELSNLRSLKIMYLPRLKSWGPLPSKLTQLDLFDCVTLSFMLKEDLKKIMSVISSKQISSNVTSLKSCKSAYDHCCVRLNKSLEIIKKFDHRNEQFNQSFDLNPCIENGRHYFPTYK